MASKRKGRKRAAWASAPAAKRVTALVGSDRQGAVAQGAQAARAPEKISPSKRKALVQRLIPKRAPTPPEPVLKSVQA
jgi:hypothetical protein